MADQQASLATRLAENRSVVGRELEEIELLMRQVQTEAERHTARRDAAAERLTALMDDNGVGQPVREAHEQLMLQYQRSSLMSAQIEVLEGKQKVLQRLLAGLEEAAAAVAGSAAQAPAVSSPHGNGGPPPPIAGQARAVLAAQEEMRRAIARQMHDGPAQSIANIALQAEVVQRLLARDPQQAQTELAALRAMVQHALEATKTFIFEVRPMVLDDLGLLATLRRTAGERQRRSGLPVRFESTGADQRLESDVETQLFRIVDDVLNGFVARKPAEVALRLDWSDEQLKVTVRSRPPEGASRPPPAAAASGADVPGALAEMIRDENAGQKARESARRRSYALPENLWDQLQERAGAVGIDLGEDEDGLRVVAVLGLDSGTTR